MRSKLRRRQWLTLCTSASLTSIAGCTGGDDGDTDDDENRGRTADEQFDGDTDDDENSGRTADEQFDGDNDRDPIELDIDPSEGWATVHADVAVPDNRGEAVLSIGGETYELSASGFAGEIQPPGESGRPPTFFELSIATVGDELSVQPLRRRLGIQQERQTYRVFEQMALVDPNATPLGEVRYGLLADGSHSESSGIGLTTQMDESFVRVDRSGVVTARGEFVTDDRGKDAGYSLDGPFEFGARLQDGWNADLDGGE
ncbi:hypothetical protein [Natrialba swarupiae]|uniref:Uncharacterized protein n=1 Tax=Natrialba swarupiae TaxID=2448032 RepID=A0A5D5ANV8_9EURY|nr:hypothetical protein [Natrialba swarupiae]TYT60801.1 hypothetical protein FYC77_16760 [Natrialba swarupiae]